MINIMDSNSFGKFIADCRKENNLTQAELGQKLSVTAKAVSRWERGVGYPDISTLEPLASTLGVSIMELMSGEKKVNMEAKFDEIEMLNETIEFLKHQRKKSRTIAIILSIITFITMILGIVLSCYYVSDLRLRAIFTLLLILNGWLANYTLRSLFRV